MEYPLLYVFADFLCIFLLCCGGSTSFCMTLKGPSPGCGSLCGAISVHHIITNARYQLPRLFLRCAREDSIAFPLIVAEKFMRLNLRHASKYSYIFWESPLHQLPVPRDQLSGLN